MVSSIENYGKRVLGSLLIKGGQGVRKAFNRLTTYWLINEYAKQAPYAMPEMLKRVSLTFWGRPGNVVLIAGPESEDLVRNKFSNHNYRLIPAEFKSFRNGESYVRIQETIRKKTVVIFRDFTQASNFNNHLIETCLLIDAAKRADAQEVVLVTPYLPYIDEKKDSGNYAIDFFKLVLNLLFKAAGLDELRVGNLTINRQTNGLFLFDKIFSRNVAPFMIAHGEKLSMLREKTPGPKDLVFMSGNNVADLARAVIKQLETRYDVCGEKLDLHLMVGEKHRLIYAQNQNVNLNGKSVYIFQTCDTNRINDDLMEALIMAYTAKKKGAKEIVLVMPYLPYGRQERKAHTREPISAKFVLNALTEAAGVTHVITLDPHAPATQGFVDIPFQFITARHLIVEGVRKMMESGEWAKDFVVVAPDVGRGKAARKLGVEILGPDSTWGEIDKDRPYAGEAKVAAVIGKVKGRDVLLFDDIGDSAGTLINAVGALRSKGAKRIMVALIHGVFSDVKIDSPEERDIILRYLKAKGKRVGDYVKEGFVVNALLRLQANPYVHKIVFTDSLNVPEKNIIDHQKIVKLSIADLLVTVCGRIIRGESLQNYQSEG